MTDRLAVFLDYQNVHLTARELFRPQDRPERSLVHPVRVAELIASRRRRPTELTSVRVFRGRPNPEHHPTPTAANDAQTAAWQRDIRVMVHRRDLNYRGWPDSPPQEKGVDVALAVDLIESALLGQYDVAVVFSGDTDLIPALELAYDRTDAWVEIAAWQGAKPRWFPRGLASTPRRLVPYCHFLTKDDFDTVRDDTDYLRRR